MKSITVIAKVRVDDVAEGIGDEELCRNLKRIVEIEWGGTVLEIGTETTATDRQRAIEALERAAQKCEAALQQHLLGSERLTLSDIKLRLEWALEATQKALTQITATRSV